MKLIVTGTGRSGTAYMYKLFNTLGVPCGHEEVFNPLGFHGWSKGFQTAKWRGQGLGIAGDEFMADSTFCALPFLRDLDGDEHVIYHIVRDPVDAWISQLSSHYNTPAGKERGGFWSRERGDDEIAPWLDFIHDHLDFGELMSPHSKSIHFMYEWTARINFERKRFAHSFTNRLEDLRAEDLKSILQLLGVDPPVSIQRAIESVDTKSNSRPRFFTRDDLHLDDPKYLDLRRFYDSI